MYNIAFTGIIIVVILGVADIDRIGAVILQAIGVLWGTLFSALAFVFPRLLEVRRARKKSSASNAVKEDIQKYLKKTEEWNSKDAKPVEKPTKDGSNQDTPEREFALGRETSINIEQALLKPTGRLSRPKQNHRKSVATEFVNGMDDRRKLLLRRSSSWNAGKSQRLDMSDVPNGKDHE